MASTRPQLQLDFDGQPRASRVYSIGTLTQELCELVETHFEDLTVEGEISNWKRASSGHCYFTLKDEDAQIRCVMWRGYAKYVFFQPEDGMLVRAKAKATVYERRGDLQLQVQSMQLAGEGALQKAFERLKRRLGAEGLFDEVHKVPLPRYPETVGVVTSGTGAALHDVLSILERRFPQVQVVVCPVQVQGMGAADAVAGAVERFNHLAADPNAFDVPVPEVLIVGRGGGSAEDLWTFNEEIVARALFASRVPIVSAVGHETDVSIADLVADVRAATPSMAAELVVPDQREVRAWVTEQVRCLEETVRLRLEVHRQRLERLTSGYGFRRPAEEVRRLRERLQGLEGRFERGAQHALTRHRHRVEALERELHALDPQRPLRRGYVRVERDGRPVLRSSALSSDDPVTLQFLDGEKRARIEE